MDNTAVDVTDRKRLHELATRWRKQATNRELFEICDALIKFMALGIQPVKLGERVEAATCLVCAQRRRRDTERQQKWRSNKLNRRASS